MVDCIHWKDCGVIDGGCCALGLYGGRPSRGVCGDHCTRRAPHPATPTREITGGMAAVFARRVETASAICRSCEHHRGFDSTQTICARRGCRACSNRVSMTLGACPIGKWDAKRSAKITGSLLDYFDRVVCISLDSTPKRWDDFCARVENIPGGFPFKKPEKFAGVDGNVTGTPEYFRQGGGAWGCLRSHLRVLEMALMAGARSLLVLEDDAEFRPPFAADAAKFLEMAPKDWEMLFLGGQHHAAPKPLAPGVMRCMNVQRTHAYAVRGKALRALYRLWASPHNAHCDWVMGPFVASVNAYAPEPFLIGQAGGRSTITGGIKPPQWWIAPSADAPVALLRCPRGVMEQLQSLGFHGGYTRDPLTGMDVGLRDLLRGSQSPGARARALRRWIEMIQWEAASLPRAVCTIWAPELPTDVAALAAQDVIVIAAATVQEALAAFNAHGKQFASAVG